MSHAIDRLHEKLVSVLIKWDEAEALKEAKRGHVNIYRMGHFLKAAQQAQDDAEANLRDGMPVEEAYLDAVVNNFTPTPRIRAFLRKNVNPTVDVHRGHWTAIKGAR